MLKRFIAILGAVFIFIGQTVLMPLATADTSTGPELISQSTSGTPSTPSNVGCGYNSTGISNDGRYVLFCTANKLDSQRTDDAVDVYVRDRIAGTTTLVSVNSSGVQENGSVYYAALSGDGRNVLFTTNATNIDSRATDHNANAYVRNLDTGTTKLVSLDNNGVLIEGGQNFVDISDDGNMVEFSGTTTPETTPVGNYGVYVRDISAGLTTLVTSHFGYYQKISGNGRFVAYTDLTSPAPYYGQAALFDTLTHQVTYVSVDGNGNLSNSGAQIEGVSNDGSYVLLLTGSTNLVGSVGSTACPIAQCPELIRHNTITNDNEAVGSTNNQNSSGYGSCCSSEGVLSDDGSTVAFVGAGDVGYTPENSISTQAYTHNFSTNITKLISKNHWGEPSKGVSSRFAISFDGKTVLMQTRGNISNFGVKPYSQLYLVSDNASFDLDNIAPQVTQATFSPNPAAQGASTTIQINGTDDKSGIFAAEYFLQEWGSDTTPGTGAAIEVPLVGGAFVSVVPSSITAGLSTGAHNVNVRIMDAAGNWSSNYVVQLNIGQPDFTPPTGAFTGSTLVVRLLLNQKVAGNAADVGTGVSSVEITSSNGNKVLSTANGTVTLNCNVAKTSCTWTANPASLNLGTQTLTLKVTDVAGNTFTTTKSYTIL